MSLPPTTTPAIQITQNGSPEVLTFNPDSPLAPLQPGQILVANAFIGVNFIDTYLRSGLYPVADFPYVLGKEASGTVVALGPPGSATDTDGGSGSGSGAPYYGLQPGDHVVYYGSGAYAGHSVVAAAAAAKLPAHIGLDGAAASFMQALTAWTLVTESHAVKKGEYVYVGAAAGGVGQWLVRFARALGGVVVAAASSGKVGVVRALEAEYVIDYTTEDVVKVVEKITGGEGVAAVFDGVGKDTFEVALKIVARKGTVVSFGNASGPVPPFSISRLGEKNIKICRPSVFTYLKTHEEFQTATDHVFNYIKDHKPKIDIYKVYPLKDAAEAHADIEGRKTTGKLLLKP